MRWTVDATAEAVATLRRYAVQYADSAGVPADVSQEIALAVSETVTNAVLHAYVGTDPGTVSLSCRTEGERIFIEVADEGAGVTQRRDSPGMGHGLAIVGSLARSLDVAARPDGAGTVVTMSFGPEPEEPEVPSLEPLCALAIEAVADVSCLDVVGEGVLRRATAEVADDPALTRWLRDAIPPAKPGTATWAALREGGARLVVHDPTVPRSPGGTGERLDLTWWLAVPLDAPDGQPAALWGLGGRNGGRPVPSEGVVGAIVSAARADLSQSAQRAVLRTRLTYA